MRGARAEWTAQSHLESLGYRAIQRNFRVAQGEIDLIMWDRETLVFVEVRSVDTLEHGHPLESITRPKQRRIIAAARRFIQDLPMPWPPMRFDAVGIVLRPNVEISHVQEAFEA